jgi:hypothetical protein
MGELFDDASWRTVLLRVLSEFGAKVAAFVPNLIGAIVLLLVGWAIARLVEVTARRALRTVGVDRAAARLRFAEVLGRAGVHLTLSEILAKLVFWLLMLTFLLASVETLRLTAATATIDRLVTYLPNLLGAILIALIGFVFARFLGSLVGATAATADLPGAARLGVLAQTIVSGLVVIVAIEQLGIAIDVLLLPFTVVLAGAGLAAALAFALGARPLVTHILAGHFLKQSLPRDGFIEVDGRRGVVERIGPIDTLLRDGDTRWSIPNGELMERVIQR